MIEGQTAVSDTHVAGPPRRVGNSLKWTLLFGFLATSLIPLAVVSAISYTRAKDSLRAAAQESLVSKVEEKAAFIGNWFRYRFIDLEQQATSHNNAKLLRELSEAFQASGKNCDEFVKSVRWTMIAEENDADLRSFRRMYDYQDAFLIDNDGNILFSVAGKDDFGTNLFHGPYANSAFSEACRRALETGRPAFSDLDYYAPSKGLPAGFITSVVVDDAGDKLGVFALQFRIDEIGNAMLRTTNRAERNATYLVGYSENRGLTFRTRLNSNIEADEATDSIPSEATAGFLHRPIDTEQTRLWRKNGSEDATRDSNSDDAFVYTGPSGERVLGVHKDIQVGDVRWGLIAEVDEQHAFAPAARLKSLVIALLTATALLVLFVATMTTRRIVRPIVQLSDAARLVASGDLTQNIEVVATNEIGALGRSFDEMVRGLREAQDRQSWDAWFSNGQSGLVDHMRGDQEIAGLARNIVTYLAKYLSAQVGAMYTPEGDNLFKLSGSYAFQVRKSTTNSVEIGEGLVGQVVLEQEHILLTQVPDDYLAVISGLGNAPPRNVLVWPIVRENEVKGVIELGSLQPFDARSLKLLELANESIAIAIDVALSHQRMRELLKQSQTQAVELQTQTEALQAREEELRNSNQTLAEKTAKLQASEETLQQQSEELETSNEELTEKTHYLQKQKTLMENAKKEVEFKAEELALASKYKSEFLANMSHELRTPLNSLLILAKSLSDNGPGNLTNQQVEAAKIIHDGGKELLTLINDILDLAKIESGKLEAFIEPVNPNTLANELRKLFSPTAEKKDVIFETLVEDDVPRSFSTDYQKLQQVLRNLLSNALKFTATGSITLRIARPEADTHFSHSNLTPETAVGFSVIDTGIGIAPDKQKSIFESFQQADGSTSRQYGGTGLGLTISREFAVLLGGELQLKSECGEGSTFTLFLPTEPLSDSTSITDLVANSTPAFPIIANQPIPPATPVKEIQETVPVHAPSANRLFLPDDRSQIGPSDRIALIVEDDRRFAQVLIDLCRKKSFKCLATDSGIEALQLASTYKPSGILLDLGLPDMDGMTVLDELKNNMATRHIPIHVVSGQPMDGTALGRGAIGFLSKPVSSEEVANALVR